MLLLLNGLEKSDKKYLHNI